MALSMAASVPLLTISSVNALLDEMWLEVLRPVRRRAIRSTPRAEADCPFEMAELHSERGKGRKGVDNQPTAIARMSVAVLGISGCLSRARRADRVGDDLVCSPCPRSSIVASGRRITKRTPGECLLHPHRSPSTS
jgi:hypothetical protein